MADGVVLDLYAEDLDKDFAGQAQVSHVVYAELCMCGCTHLHVCML